jgi:FlaA1/EpsC-like NDP-sugar epimerase
MEMNPCEAVLNNVVGTRILVELSQAFDVARFVFISTDKAVKPVSIMGASKRVCEMIVQARAGTGQTRFACVRFGNVMGSRGSVIPLFQQQIARGGPITVTHPDVQRFLMTIPEAVRLVIQAGTLASSGEIFILDMGDPVPIMDLARDLIELSGLRPGRDIQIEMTRLGPGEKLSEELIDSTTEQLASTHYEKIRVVQGRGFDTIAFASELSALEEAARRESPQGVYQTLQELHIGFEPAFRSQIKSEDLKTRDAQPVRSRTATSA